MFKLLKGNLDFLTTKGSLKTFRHDLPRTVIDAIDLTKAINERYLWVDALCLVQDDEEDMKIGIGIMNSIYQGSYLSIVAGSGSDASVGLPGVRPGTRRSQQVIMELQRLKMTILHGIDWHLRRSEYNDRGWTLQEMVLSKRSIIFVNNQMYYRCQEANWNEESWADLRTHWIDPDDSNISRIPEESERKLSSFWAWQKLCENYTRRKLRYDGDALRAIAGILRPLAAGMYTDMVEGLPGFYLDMSLLFISSRSNLQRRPGFASFSWAGWSGQVMWPRENSVCFQDEEQNWDMSNLFKWLKQKTFIDWSVWQRSGEVEVLAPTLNDYERPSRLSKLIESFPLLFPMQHWKISESEGIV
jgi:hypothetical protein